MDVPLDEAPPGHIYVSGSREARVFLSIEECTRSDEPSRDATSPELERKAFD